MSLLYRMDTITISDKREPLFRTRSKHIYCSSDKASAKQDRFHFNETFRFGPCVKAHNFPSHQKLCQNARHSIDCKPYR